MAASIDDVFKDIGTTLKLELTRIGKQKCAYCDGFGHAGNDCPTDFKLAQLRIGVREQAQLLLEMRKAARDRAAMKDVKGFSLLSGRPKRKRARIETSLSDGDTLATKRLKI